MSMPNGSNLTDPQHATRLHWAKVLTLVLLFAPSNGIQISPGYLSSLQVQLQFLISWMSHVGYQSPHELTPSVVDIYLDYLPQKLFGDSSDTDIGTAVANRVLKALDHLWNQRGALLKMGIAPLPRHPFRGETSSRVSKNLATKAAGWIRPLPDEVAIPVLNKAAWFLGEPAEDVLILLDSICRADAETKGMSYCVRVKDKMKAERVLHSFAKFKFRILEGETAPWHVTLDEQYELSSDAPGARFARFKELWEAVRDSAQIIIQGTSGMRVSELLGISHGIDASTSLPASVRLESSLTGLYEWFTLRSQLSKGNKGLPRDVDWVLGMRQAGSNEIPLAVRALQILERLHAPWRALAQTDRLILNGSQGRGMPSTLTKLSAMTIDRANVGMQRFIDRWVDLSNLPDESARRLEDNDLVIWREQKGKAFKTSMLRKTWAQFALACDSRLLPAIQMQFHHLSLAMTESGYIGNNPLLVNELHSVSTQKTILTVFEIIHGEKVSGRMGEQLEKRLEELRASAGALSTSQRWQQAAEWTSRNDLKMFFTPHATCCPTQTSKMRCHNASGTPTWLRRGPNFATREPNVCAGCACAIMSKSHEPFWSDRLVDCEISLRQAKLAGADMKPFREVQFRADQSVVILKKFGTDLDVLEARITSQLARA